VFVEWAGKVGQPFVVCRFQGEIALGMGRHFRKTLAPGRRGGKRDKEG
jgi:hypothetical protein